MQVLNIQKHKLQDTRGHNIECYNISVRGYNIEWHAITKMQCVYRMLSQMSAWFIHVYNDSPLTQIQG